MVAKRSSMRTKVKIIISLAVVGSLPHFVEAQPVAHYCPGVEGLLGSSVPPPGLYARDYNVFYTADTVNDASGRSAGPANFHAFTYVQIPRICWVSDAKFLGGNVGVTALLPFVDQNIRSGAFDSSTFGMGDFLLEGLLSWHTPRFDFVAASGVWMPTGDSAAPPTTRAGMGFWTEMLTGGVTWYPDKDKTWAISALNRYEFSSEQRDTHITPGQEYTLEWGISKKLPATFYAGATGYYQQQVTTSSGAGASPDRSRVAAVGPEISATIPKIAVITSLRYLYEFMAESRAQGQTIALTFTRRF